MKHRDRAAEWVLRLSLVLLSSSTSSLALAQAGEDDLEIEAATSADDLEIEAAPEDLEIEAAPPHADPPEATSSSVAASAPTSSVAASAPSAEEELAALRARLADLEARVARAEAAAPSGEATGASEATEASDHAAPAHDLAEDILHGLSLSAYLQVQYVWSQLSQDELSPDGSPLNRDRFEIRRGRVRLRGQWDAFSLDFEVDGSTTRGPFFGIRHATLGLAYQGTDASAPPFVAGLVGLTEVPFGHELRVGQRDLPFMERTTGSLAFFRGPVDVGARMFGGLGPVRYDLAVMTGSPIDDRAGAAQVDPTAAPDVVGRVGFESQPHEALTLAAGASFLWGTGFSAGQAAQKSRLEWLDLNESGTLDTGEITVVPARAAVPSSTFPRWAVGVDLEAALTTDLGRTDLFGEVILATNIDRGLYVADPVRNGADVREVSAYVALVQSILGWGVVGFRYDYYDPNSDFVDQRRGLSVPTSAALHTFSPMAGVTLPPDLVPWFRGRVVVQYDAVLDQLGRDSRGVPTDLGNDQLTVRVQGELR
ncbi:MAG: hypothetical protein U0234_22075 [Sandaracinus sp.]